MGLTEIDLFGVYVAPISILMIVAWLLYVPVRRVADHFGLFRDVWHPALFWFAMYLVLLAAVVLLAAH